MIGFVLVGVLGVLFFFAGLKGWKYPRLKCEVDDDYKKPGYKILKILVGIGLIIVGIGGILANFSNGFLL